MWMVWVIAALLLFIFIQSLVISGKDNELENLKKIHLAELGNMSKRHRIDLEKQKSEYESIISSSLELEKLTSQLDAAKKERARLAALTAKERVERRKAEIERCRIKKAPLDVYFADDGMPIYWKPDLRKPYGDYTVFLNAKSGIYHVDRYCASYYSKLDHIFNVIDHARPCRKCAVDFFTFTTVPDWFTRN